VEQTFDTATDAEIEAALAGAHAAYDAWKDVPIEDRAKVVTRIAELFVERKDELGAIATKEMGKPLSEAVGEAEFCGDIFSYFATEGPTLAADSRSRRSPAARPWSRSCPSARSSASCRGTTPSTRSPGSRPRT
jgi:succinate-semialdehyde dehydrogenase/glutarate-semialdehyde dehydrogenase